MAKQAYVSISDLAWNAMGHPDFDKLKTGYIGDTPVLGRKYEVVGGIPATAKLTTVIYVYEDESLEDVAHPFSRPSVAVMTRAFADKRVIAILKLDDGTEELRTIEQATEFLEAYRYEPLIEVCDKKKEITFMEDAVFRPLRFKLSEKDSEGRYIYLPAN